MVPARGEGRGPSLVLRPGLTLSNSLSDPAVPATLTVSCALTDQQTSELDYPEYIYCTARAFLPARGVSNPADGYMEGLVMWS